MNLLYTLPINIEEEEKLISNIKSILTSLLFPSIVESFIVHPSQDIWRRMSRAPILFNIPSHPITQTHHIQIFNTICRITLLVPAQCIMIIIANPPKLALFRWTRIFCFGYLEYDYLAYMKSKDVRPSIPRVGSKDEDASLSFVS